MRPLSDSAAAEGDIQCGMRLPFVIRPTDAIDDAAWNRVAMERMAERMARP